MDHAPHRRPQRQLSILAILIVVVATPATLALSYYHLTGDPTFRPLAVTVERMILGGQHVEGVEVRIVVSSDGTVDGEGRSRRFGKRLVRALYGKGVGAHLTVQEAPGPRAIHFIVGTSWIGPFDERSAAQGIRIAAEAAALARREASRSREHSW